MRHNGEARTGATGTLREQRGHDHSHKIRNGYYKKVIIGERLAPAAVKDGMGGARESAARTLKPGQGMKHTLGRPLALGRVDHGEERHGSQCGHRNAGSDKYVLGFITARQ